MMVAWLLAGALAAASGGAGTERVEELLASGNRHYEAGDYAGAAGDYQRILDYGIESHVVHYNLGNAQFKQGHLGEAILSYERALVLSPRDAEAAGNLAYAVSLTVDAVEVPEPPFPLRALLWMVHRTTPGEDALLLLLVVYLLGATSTVAIFLGPGRRRPLAYVAVAFLLLGAWSGGALAWKEYQELGRERAVVLTEKVDALSGPAVDYTPLFTVHEGLQVQVRSRRGEWLHIVLPNGLNGWVPAGSLGLV
jgi:tetratricopeptide (TPR) repeat protein